VFEVPLVHTILQNAVHAGELFQLGLFVFIHGQGFQLGIGLADCDKANARRQPALTLK
jgi:hypothetical protein